MSSGGGIPRPTAKRWIVLSHDALNKTHECTPRNLQKSKYKRCKMYVDTRRDTSSSRPETDAGRRLLSKPYRGFRLQANHVARFVKRISATAVDFPGMKTSRRQIPVARDWTDTAHDTLRQMCMVHDPTDRLFRAWDFADIIVHTRSLSKRRYARTTEWRMQNPALF